MWILLNYAESSQIDEYRKGSVIFMYVNRSFLKNQGQRKTACRKEIFWEYFRVV